MRKIFSDNYFNRNHYNNKNLMSRLFLEIYTQGWYAKILRNQKKITSEVLLDLQILDVKHVGQHV